MPERRREPINRGNRRPFLASESRFMPDQNPDTQNASELRLKALSRWDNEGGAAPDGPQEHSLDVNLSEFPPLTDAELMQLRVRVIALENLIIMMLAEGSDRQGNRVNG